MKEFKGSNFLLLFILLIDCIYLVPFTIECMPGDGAFNNGLHLFSLLSSVVHLIICGLILIYPFLGEMENIEWGEDVCTKIYLDKYSKSKGVKYRFSIALLIVYLAYQPVKRLINWTDKYLTIQLNKKEDDQR